MLIIVTVDEYEFELLAPAVTYTVTSSVVVTVTSLWVQPAAPLLTSAADTTLAEDPPVGAPWPQVSVSVRTVVTVAPEVYV